MKVYFNLIWYSYTERIYCITIIELADKEKTNLMVVGNAGVGGIKF